MTSPVKSAALQTAAMMCHPQESTLSILRPTFSAIPACPSGVAEDATTRADPDRPASAE